MRQSHSKHTSVCLSKVAVHTLHFIVMLQYCNVMFLFHGNNQLSLLPISVLVPNNLGIDKYTWQYKHLAILPWKHKCENTSVEKWTKVIYKFLDTLLDTETNNRPYVCSAVNHGKNSKKINIRFNLTCRHIKYLVGIFYRFYRHVVEELVLR